MIIDVFKQIFQSNPGLSVRPFTAFAIINSLCGQWFMLFLNSSLYSVFMAYSMLV